MSVLNLYKPIRRSSYVLISIFLLLILSYQYLVLNRGPLGFFVVLGSAVALFAIWRVLRPGASGVQSAEEVYEAVGNGRPTFLNVYSKY